MELIFAQSKAEKLVNDHLIKMQKKLEIQSQKKEADLYNEKPKEIRKDTLIKKTLKFSTDPERVYELEELKNNKETPSPTDPSVIIDKDIEQNRDVTSEEMTDEEFIREFQKNAEKAGLKLKINPKTLEVKEEK